MEMSVSRGAKVLALSVLCASLAACGLPRSGPNKSEIYKGSVLKQGDALFVEDEALLTLDQGRQAEVLVFDLSA